MWKAYEHIRLRRKVVVVQNVAELEGSTPFDEPERHMYLSMGTLSSSPEAIVASLAFIVSDPRRGEPVTHYFKTVAWDQAGRNYNFNTIQSIMGYSTLARKSVTNQTPPVQLAEALASVSNAYKNNECVAIWATAADLAILRNAMDMLKIGIPWGHGDQRDIVGILNTLSDLGLATNVERDQTEPQNVSLGDAAYICRHVTTMYRGFRPGTAAGDKTLSKGEVTNDHVQV